MAGRRFRKTDKAEKTLKREPKKPKQQAGEKAKRKKPTYLEKEQEFVETRFEKEINDPEYLQVLESKKNYELRYGPLPKPEVKKVEPVVAEPEPDPLSEVDQKEIELFNWTPDDMKEGERLSRKKFLAWVKESFQDIGFDLKPDEAELVEILSLELVQLQQQLDISRLRRVFNLNAVELLAAQSEAILIARRNICNQKGLTDTVKRLSAHLKHLHAQEEQPSKDDMAKAVEIFEVRYKDLISQISRLWESGVPYEQRFRARHKLQLAFGNARSVLGIWNPESARLLRRAQAFWCFDEIHITTHPSLSKLLRPIKTKKKISNPMKEKGNLVEPAVPEELGKAYNRMMAIGALPGNKSVTDFMDKSVTPNMTVIRKKEGNVIGTDPVENPTNLFISLLYQKLKRTSYSFDVLAAAQEFGDTPIALLQVILCGRKKFYLMKKEFKEFYDLLAKEYPDTFGEEALFKYRVKREPFRKAGRKRNYLKVA